MHQEMLHTSPLLSHPTNLIHPHEHQAFPKVSEIKIDDVITSDAITLITERQKRVPPKTEKSTNETYKMRGASTTKLISTLKVPSHHQPEIVRAQNARVDKVNETRTPIRPNVTEADEKKVEVTNAPTLATPKKVTKPVAIRFDQKGELLGKESEDSSSEEVKKKNAEKAAPGAPAKGSCKDGAAHKEGDDKHEPKHKKHENADDVMIDPANEASKENRTSDESSSEGDNIPVITLPLGDILEKYQRMVRGEHRSSESEEPHEKKLSIKPYSDKKERNEMKQNKGKKKPRDL